MKHKITRRHTANSSRGFTLTELLVVITIIIVLAALSLTGMRRMRAMADKANSTRNISQLQIANVSYATDHNGNFVPIRANDEKGNATRWFQDPKFLENLTSEMPIYSGPQAGTMPLGMLDPKVVRARRPLHDRLYCSYGMNDTGLQLGGEPDIKSFHSMNRIPDPSQSMAFATATDFRVAYNSRFRWDFENPNDSKTGGGEIAYRHSDKVLVVYFDGHVGEMSKGDFEAIDKSRGGKNSSFWNPIK